MAYADAANYNRAKPMKGLPVGSIVPWSGDLAEIPVGWVACNGSTVQVTRYPLLYDVIGNVYGGVANSTFRIPSLNNNPKAIMDIFPGHYDYLKTLEAAHRPETTVRSSDPFWLEVGGGNNADEPASGRQDYFSTIDVVGEIRNMPNLVASYRDISVSTGEYQSTVSFNERKLSDRHVPPHAHGYTNTDAVGWSRNNSNPLICGSWAPDFQCGVNASCTQMSRVVTGGTGPVQGGGGDSFAIPGNTSANLQVSGGGAGGGNFQAGPRAGPQTAAFVYVPGDGVSSGNMTPAAGTLFATSLSNPETTFAQITGHTHGSNQIEFVSRISVINPGIVNDVRLGSVRIDNSTGRDFATINISSATPYLSMIFIIKAY